MPHFAISSGAPRSPQRSAFSQVHFIFKSRHITPRADQLSFQRRAPLAFEPHRPRKTGGLASAAPPHSRRDLSRSSTRSSGTVNTGPRSTSSLRRTCPRLAGLRTTRPSSPKSSSPPYSPTSAPFSPSSSRLTTRSAPRASQTWPRRPRPTFDLPNGPCGPASRIQRISRHSCERTVTRRTG